MFAKSNTQISTDKVLGKQSGENVFCFFSKFGLAGENICETSFLGWMILGYLVWIYHGFCKFCFILCSPCPVCSESFTFMTRENIVSGPHHLEGARVWMHLAQTRVPSLGCYKRFIGPVTQLSKVPGHQQPQPIMVLRYLNPHCLLIQEKSHSSSACLMSQASRFVAAGTSQFGGDENYASSCQQMPLLSLVTFLLPSLSHKRLIRLESLLIKARWHIGKTSKLKRKKICLCLSYSYNG